MTTTYTVPYLGLTLGGDLTGDVTLAGGRPRLTATAALPRPTPRSGTNSATATPPATSAGPVRSQASSVRSSAGVNRWSGCSGGGTASGRAAPGGRPRNTGGPPPSGD